MKKIMTIVIILLALFLSACSKTSDMTQSISNWSENLSEIKFQVLKSDGSWDEKVLTTEKDFEPITLYLTTGEYSKKKKDTISEPIAKLEFSGHKFVFQDSLVSIDEVVYDTGESDNAKHIVEIFTLGSK